MHIVLPVRAEFGALRTFARRSRGNCRGRAKAAAAASAPLTSRAGCTITFTDHKTLYEHKSTRDLCRSLLVLRLCSLPPFVQHSEWLLGVDSRGGDRSGATAIVPTIAHQWLREAIYVHFCAGAAPAEAWARMNSLRANGVGAILDFATHPDDTAAAAAAVGDGVGPDRTSAAAPSPPRRHHHHDNFEAQTWTGAADARCAQRLDSLLACIDTAAVLPGTGFIAVQLPALCAPGLLEALAAALGQLHPAAFPEADGDVWVSRRGFDQMIGGKVATAAMAAAGSGPGTSKGSGLSAVQVRQLELLQGRLDRLAERAVDKGVKLVFQADEAAQQLRPALEHIAHGLMRRHNAVVAEGAAADAAGGGGGGGGGGAAVFLAYAAHLADTSQRLRADLERAEGQGYTLGVQLVDCPAATPPSDAAAAASGAATLPAASGAAAAASSSSSLEVACCLDVLLGAVRSGGAEVMLSSHSHYGVETAVGAMSRLGLVPEEAPVYFVQQLGLADSISFALGAAGYRVYKHCPLGDVDTVVPYLVQRIRETQTTLELGAPPHEVRLMERELWRRLVQQPVSELGAAAAELLARGAGGGGGVLKGTVAQ